jgi:hypothetical protein
MYYPIKESDFRDHILEVTVWDFNKYGASQFLGEVSLEIWFLFSVKVLHFHE